MQFGLFTAAAARFAHLETERQVYSAFTDYVCEAEALGFKSFFIAEHHFTGISQISAVLNFLCFLAAKTERIRLGTAVSVLTWHNPALLAEQAATVDMLSNGRLDLGVGRGYRLSEFEGFAIPFEEAAERYEESLAFLRKAWTSEGRFSHRGKHWTFENIVVEPAPIQRPHPPLWVGAGGAPSLRAAAAADFNILLDQVAAPALIGERLATYRAALQEAGHAWHPRRVGVTRAFHLTRNQAERELAYQNRAAFLLKAAELQGAARAQSSLGLPTSIEEVRAGTETAALIGDPGEIIGRIEALKAQGVDYVLLMDVGVSMSALATFAREVMPAFPDAAVSSAA